MVRHTATWSIGRKKMISLFWWWWWWFSCWGWINKREEIRRKRCSRLRYYQNCCCGKGIINSFGRARGEKGLRVETMMTMGFSWDRSGDGGGGVGHAKRINVIICFQTCFCECEMKGENNGEIKGLMMMTA